MKYRGFDIVANTHSYELWSLNDDGELEWHLQTFEGVDIDSYTFTNNDDVLDNEYGDFKTIDETKKFIDGLIEKEITDEIKERLEYLRGEIRAERISYGEIAELINLEKYIDNGDVELLEWAEVKEGTR